MMVEEELESERGSFMMQECGGILGESMELIKEQFNNQSCLLVTRGPPERPHTTPEDASRDCSLPIHFLEGRSHRSH